MVILGTCSDPSPPSGEVSALLRVFSALGCGCPHCLSLGWIRLPVFVKKEAGPTLWLGRQPEVISLLVYTWSFFLKPETNLQSMMNAKLWRVWPWNENSLINTICTISTTSRQLPFFGRYGGATGLTNTCFEPRASKRNMLMTHDTQKIFMMSLLEM